MASDPVGLVGVGAMGGAFLHRLRLAGRRVLAYDVSPACREAAAAEGAGLAASLGDLAGGTRLIDVWVRDDQDVLECMLAGDGIVAAAAPGTLVLLHSTVRPQTTRAVAEAGERRGVAVMDACVTAVPRMLRAGRASFLIGGDPDRMEQVRGHLLPLGRQVLYMGPLGFGNAAKLIRNYVTASETLIVEEALRVGEAFGIPPRDALEMMAAVYAGGVLDHWERVFGALEHGATPLPNDLMMGKDVPLFVDLARSLQVSVPVAERLEEAGHRVLHAHGRG